MQAIALLATLLIWTGATSTLWSVATNWNPAQVPASGVITLRFPDGVTTKVSRNDVDLSAATPIEMQIQASGYDIDGNAVPTCLVDASYTSGSSSIGVDVIGHASCASVEFRTASGGTLNIAGDLPAKSLVKSGGGTAHFQIADASTRDLRITGGAAVVESAWGGTTVTLDGGTLAGSGTVASITGGSGSVSPGGNAVMAGIRGVYGAAGDGAGTLTSGNVSLTTASTVTIELAGASSADRLSVTGSVSLGGAALAATLGFSPSTTASTVFTIVENDGSDAVSGTFNGLAEGAAMTSGGRSLRISYVGGTGNDVTLTVLPVPVTLSLTPSALAAMTAGVATAQTIASTNGTGPFTFAVTAGTLPAGLSLAATGSLSGTPTTAGSYSFTVTATDSLSNTGTRTYTGTIGSASATLTVSPSSLPAMRVGAAFSQTLTASGGTAPYTYAVTGGALPAGLSLSTSGALTGTPTSSGTYSVTITVTDSGLVASVNKTATIASTTSITYTGMVAAAAVTLSVGPATLPAFTVGEAASSTITASGGTAPYTYAVTGGALPAGLSLAASGAVTGTPTAAGAYSMTVTAADADGNTGTITYSGTVAPAPVPALPGWALIALALALAYIGRGLTTSA